MKPDPRMEGARRLRRAVWHVVLPYVVFASLWIVLSDRALELLPGGSSAWAQTLKGWFFVLITAALLYGVVRDMLRRITEADHRLLEAQAERLHALGLLDAIADGSSDAIFAKDAAGRYMLFNRAAATFTGHAIDDVMGKDDVAVLGADCAAKVMENDRLVMTLGTVITFEEILATPAGQLTLMATKGPLRDAGGRVVGLFGISRDITAMKRAEFELRKLSLVVEQSPEGVIITDLDGVIEYANDAFSQHSGYVAEEVRGWSASRLGDADTPDGVFDDLWVALRQEQIWRGEFINRRKDGSTYVVAAKVLPIRQADGRISNYVSIQEDVSEKRRIAAELERYRMNLEELVASRTCELSEATARAEAANKAKSQFLAIMSHEIRTPMNAIIGLIHLLRKERPGAHQLERLARIDGAANHLLQIINDILDLSKVEAGRMSLEETDFPLAGVFAHVRSLVADQALAKGIRLRVDIGAVPARLRGDETRLRQALLNYVANAVKFTERGEVVMRARIVEDRGETLMLRFEVSDTGIGIPAGRLPGLFQVFEQVDVSTARRYGGSGLGLAITRSIAGLMGGEAGADSEEGHGSIFWFTARLGRAHILQTEPPTLIDDKDKAPSSRAEASASAAMTPAGPVEPEPDAPAVARAVAEMEVLLAAANMRSNAVLERERTLFGMVLEADFARFERHVSRFEYPEAHALLMQHRLEEG